MLHVLMEGCGCGCGFFILKGLILTWVLLLSLLDVVAVGWLCECCSKLIFRFFFIFFVLIFSSGCSSCVELLLIFLLR